MQQSSTTRSQAHMPVPAAVRVTADRARRWSAAIEPSEPSLDPGDEAAPGTPGTGENICPRCSGSGRDAGAECPECGGTGKVITGIGGG